MTDPIEQLAKRNLTLTRQHTKVVQLSPSERDALVRFVREVERLQTFDLMVCDGDSGRCGAFMDVTTGEAGDYAETETIDAALSTLRKELEG